MGTYPTLFHTHGKDFVRTTPSSPPAASPALPGPAPLGRSRAPRGRRGLMGPKWRPRAPRRSAAPELPMARSHPLNPAPSGRPHCPSRSPPAPHSPGPGPALPSPWRRSCSCGRPPAPRPDRKRKDSSPARHYVNVPPLLGRRFCRAGRSTPDHSPSSAPSSSPGPSPQQSPFGPAAPIPSLPGAFVPLRSPPKQGTLFRRRDPA